MKLTLIIFSLMLLVSACGADRSQLHPKLPTGALTGGGDSINNGEGYFKSPSQRDWDLESIPKSTRRYYEWHPITPSEQDDTWRHV